MTIAVPSLRAVVCAPGWVRNDLWRRARAVPSLDLRFAENKSLVDAVSGQNLITFTRASSGTYVDSAGVIRTAANDAPRSDHNPTTGESLGLLIEEQRTNLLLNSATLSTQSVTVTAAAHTLSFTGTGTITLSGTSTAGPLVGTGTGEANRVSLTFTPTAGTLTLTVSGTVSNAQLEVGVFRTSYIPTTDSAATRAADVASITGSNFSSWYSSSQGALHVEYSIPFDSSTSIFPLIAGFSDGTFNNAVLHFNRTVDDGRRALIRNVGVSSFDQANSTAYVYGQTGRQAFAYAGSDFALSAAGASPTVSTSIAWPTVNQAGIGSTAFVGGALSSLNGTIRRLTYFPQRLPNTTLQSLTQ